MKFWVHVNRALNGSHCAAHPDAGVDVYTQVQEVGCTYVVKCPLCLAKLGEW